MNKEEMLALVEQSPRAVAAQDRDVWLSLFSRLAVIEDPVGSRPHIGGIFDARSGLRANGALQRFYDTFIQGNRIEFIRERDHVAGNLLMRDLALELEVNGMQATVPMHLLYELIEEEGVLKVQRLNAHWEILPVTLQMMRSNPAGLFGYGVKLIRGLGIGGVLGFCRGILSVGSRGKRSFMQFVEANNQGLMQESLFADSCRGIRWPDSDGWITASEFKDMGLKLVPGKTIAAGNRVTSSLEIHRSDQITHGVAIAEFNRRSGRIDSITFIL
jgi:hypothetical protein